METARSTWVGMVAAAAAVWLGAPVASAAQWESIQGSLKQISVGSAQHVWGVNQRDEIYRWIGRGWERVAGALVYISVGADGTVWGVNRGGAIFRYMGPRPGRSPWQRMPGSLVQISVGDARQVWGVNRGDFIYRWTGRGWQNIGGRLKHISVGADGTVWGVNRGGAIYRFKGQGWQWIPGRLVQISVGSAAKVLGIQAQGRIYRWTGRTWQPSAGQLKHISVAADGTLWGVTAHGRVQRWSDASVATVARPVATVARPVAAVARPVATVARLVRVTKPAPRGSTRPPPGGAHWGRAGIGKPRSKPRAPAARASGYTLRLMGKVATNFKPLGVAKLAPGKVIAKIVANLPELRAFQTLGALVPVKWVLDELRKKIKEGKALPGNPLVREYERWQTDLEAKRVQPGTPPPGHLSHSDIGLKLFKSGYLGMLLPDLKHYVQYIADKVFGSRREWIGKWKTEAPKLLFKYGCKRISRLMPGFAKVVKKRISTDIGTAGAWARSISPEALAKALKKPCRPGKGRCPPKPPDKFKPEVRIIEICTVTHKQLEATLRKDLELLVKPVQPRVSRMPPAPRGYRGPRLAADLIVPLSERGIREGPKRHRAPPARRSAPPAPSRRAPAAPPGGGSWHGPSRAKAAPPGGGSWRGPSRAKVGLIKKVVGFKPVQMVRVVEILPLFTDLRAYDPRLKGETFHDISKRLISFYRKTGEARNFERATSTSREEVVGLAKDVGGKAPNQAKGEELKDAADPHTMGTRNDREVMRRKVEQWTYGYEYEQLVSYIRGENRRDLSSPKRVRSQAQRRAFAQSFPRLVKDYGAAEKKAVAAFWEDCSELHAICEEPKTKRERDACIRCAEEAARKHCLMGRKKTGNKVWTFWSCRGIAKEQIPKEWYDWLLKTNLIKKISPFGSVGPGQKLDLMYKRRMYSTWDRPGGTTFLNWLAVQVVAEAHQHQHHAGYYAMSKQRLWSNAVLDVVDRKIVPSKDAQGEGISTEGKRYLDSLPITAWQRCILWNPYPGLCDRQDGGMRGFKQQQKKAGTQYIPWHLSRLFRMIEKDRDVSGFLDRIVKFWNIQCGPRKVKGLWAKLKDRGRRRLCGKVARAGRRKADEFFKRSADDAGLGGNGRLKSAGSAISGVLGPIVGKILAMLLKAAGMYETMKTLARASGITPSQSADCEDAEYRRDVMKLKGKEDHKRGCLMRVFAKNFTGVLESIIVMLGNKLVDWGIDLLRMTLQGVKSALISAAGSVPFAGGFLAALVDIGWELIMNFGAKALLKGFVVAKLPVWLKVKELAKDPIEKVLNHPIVSVVMGVILELIDSAMKYGDKSWMSVGIDSVINAIQVMLQNKQEYFWVRALVYAKRELAKLGSAEMGFWPQLVEVGKAMIRGFATVVKRRLDDPWRSLFEDLVDQLESAVSQGTLSNFRKNPVGTLMDIIKTKLGPLVLPILSSVLPVSGWVKELLGSLGKQVYNLLAGKPGQLPSVAVILKMVVAPIREVVWKRVSFGDPGLKALGKKLAEGIDWVIGNLGQVKSQYLDRPANIAQKILSLVGNFVQAKAPELIERMKAWSPALQPQAVQTAVQALLKRGLNAVARVLATTTRGAGSGKKLSAGELLVKLAQATTSVSNDALKVSEWQQLARGGGGLLLVHLVKELVGHVLATGPIGKVIRKLLDGVGLLLSSEINLTGHGVLSSIRKFLDNLHDAVSSFCEKTLLGPLEGTKAYGIAKAILDAGLGLLKGNAKGLRQLISKAKGGATALLGKAKSLLGSMVTALVDAATKGLSTLGTILKTTVGQALKSW